VCHNLQGTNVRNLSNVYYRPDETHPSALLALQKGLQLSKVLKDATSVEHKSIVTFRNLRQDVYAQLSENEQFTGVKVSGGVITSIK